MRSIVPILILLLLGWLGLGTWWHYTHCGAGSQLLAGDKGAKPAAVATTPPADAKPAVAAAAAAKPLLIRDGSKFTARAEEDFTFPRSNFKPNIPAKTENALRQLAAYLKNNPDRKLTLIGNYAGSENNTTRFSNLGIARADDVKRKLVTLGAPEGQLQTAGRKNDGIEFKNNLLYGGIGYQFANAPVAAATADAGNEGDGAGDGAGDGNATANVQLPPMVVTAPGLNIREKANITFPKSGFEVDKPLPPQVQGAYKKMGDYMTKNPDKNLKVTGVYGKDEKNESLLKTLGLARANNVKQELIKSGVDSKQIETADKLRPNLQYPNDKVLGGVTYEVVDAPKDDAANEAAAKLAQIEKDLKASPRNLYFETAKTQLIMDQDLRNYFTNLIYYMDKKGDVEVTVTGHTDNVGNEESNMKYGAGRAKFVKDYMVKNGAPNARIKSSSKGESAPIATNDTNEGKAKNRRVEVRLK